MEENTSDLLRKLKAYLLFILAIKQSAENDNELDKFKAYWIDRKEMKDIWKTICRERGMVYKILND